MNEPSIQRWIENAEAGIKDNKPNYVLTSSNRLKSLNRADLSENILKEAFVVFDDNIPLFRELSNTIIARDANDGLSFAEGNINKFGNQGRFQKAVALSKLKRNSEAIKEIENIIGQDQELKKERFIISKLISLYNEEGLFGEAQILLEPLVDKGIFEDLRMKQLLATILVKSRKSLPKVLELLKYDVDPRSSKLKNQASETIGIEASVTSELHKQSIAGQPNVFIVYGHDEIILDKVELCLHKIGANPMHFKNIPHEGSKTNIEILEQYIPQSDAIIIIMTPDDEGRKRGSSESLKPRPRQNVLIEAGFAVISMRNNSILLTIGTTEDFIPTDLAGINRVHRSEWSEAIEFEIAKRLKNMKLNVSLDTLY